MSTRTDVLEYRDEYTIRVKTTASPQQIAATIRVAIIDEHKLPILRAIGAGAVGQACKGIAIARGYIATQGFDLATTIGFARVMGENGAEINSQTFHLFLR